MDKLSVVMLGKFDICMNGQSILAHIGNSPKSIDLLKYLILNRGKALSVSSLIDIFWHESEKSTNPENALKTMVSRLRSRLLKASPAFKNCIISENHSYMWNKNIPCLVDVFVFEKLCADVQKVDYSQKRNIFMQVLEIYSGDLTYAAMEEEWLVSRSLYLHHLYIQTIYRFVEFLKSEKDNEMIVHVCRIALDIDILDEKLNLELMQALKEVGQNSAALKQYKHITSTYDKYLGMEPSDHILNFYNKLFIKDLSSEADILEIRNDLIQIKKQIAGAFVCDYSIFKDIYQLQLRNLDRQANHIFLALLTVESTMDSYIEPLMMDSIMRQLVKILRNCLRKGDAMARYSSSQYAILLPMRNSSNGYVVANRIKKLFFKEYTDNSTRLLFHLGGIDQEKPLVL